MKNNIKVISLSFILMSTLLIFASDPVRESEDIKKTLENNSEVDPSRFLSERNLAQYQRERIRTTSGFSIDKPITIDQAENLNHPYLQEMLERIDNNDLEELAKLEQNQRFSQLRINSIYNEGLKFGTQNALYETIYEFNEDLVEVGDFYDRIFNFNLFMLADGRVRPPVLVEMSGGVSKEDNRTLRRSVAAYKIIRQAEVVTRAPSYIDYLNFRPIQPAAPQSLLLPRSDNDSELIAWREGVRKGWQLGVRQGMNVINEGLYSLIRDYEGMAQFYVMSKTGAISVPRYQEMNLGVTTDGRNLQIGEEIFSITILPEFNNDAQKWKPLPRVDDFLEID